MRCFMRRTTQAGVEGCSPGCWADDGRCGPAEPGAVSGGAAGGRHGGGLRPVPHFAGTGQDSAAVASAGPAVLAGGHCSPVPVVPGCLGGTDQGVWGCLLSDGRSGLFLGCQPMAAEAGIPGGGPGGCIIGHFDLSTGVGGRLFKKIQKNCEKHLPFRGEMV